LLGDGFCADGEGVKDIETEGEADGFVLAIAECALAENLHTEDGFAGSFHFAKNADDRVGFGVHVCANGIDAGEVDLNPG